MSFLLGEPRKQQNHLLIAQTKLRACFSALFGLRRQQRREVPTVMNNDDFIPGNPFAFAQISRGGVRNGNKSVDEPAALAVEPKVALYELPLPPEFTTVAGFDYRPSPEYARRGNRA